ncbi:MAG: hypothetical protein K9N38_04495 [Candidatus Marinimicrobia bacterium]|nr:hypothetical protein [Candidatus Neomarinimicrobiota bacterium]
MMIKLRSLILPGIAWLLSITSLTAADPPKELEQVIDDFMNLEATSLQVSQVIDWRFSSKNDSIIFQMDIKEGRNFHLDLAAFGLEIFVSETEMMTLNHSRSQIIYEDASPDALLKQLFVGGDLNDARFKDEKMRQDGLRELRFRFASDFSDWDRLTVILDGNDTMKGIHLFDYDGNLYKISFQHLPNFSNFNMPDVDTEYLHYQIADLRK